MNSPGSSLKTIKKDSARSLSASGVPVDTNCLSGEESDYISQRRCKLQQELVFSLKDDLAEWIVKTLGPTNISAENFIQALDNGVILCQISLIIEKKAKEYVEMGKCTSTLPSYKMHCNKNARSGTWLARDNTANFLKWCRAYGLKDEHLFDSEDLVTHHKEMQVIYCLMELARLGARYGLEPPTLISMEEEIDSDSTVANIPPLPSHSPETSFDLTRANSLDKFDAQVAETEAEPLPSLDTEVAKIAVKYCRQKHVKRLSMGLYLVFGKQVYIRLLKHKHLMVRVGGGWDTFENYLIHHATGLLGGDLKKDHTRSNTLPPRSGSRNFKQRQRSASLSSYSVSRKVSTKTNTPLLVETAAMTEPTAMDPIAVEPSAPTLDSESQAINSESQPVNLATPPVLPKSPPVDSPSQTIIKALYSTASLVNSLTDSYPHSISPTHQSM